MNSETPEIGALQQMRDVMEAVSPLTSEAWTAFSQALVQRHFPRGTAFCRPGDTELWGAYVVSGLWACCYTTPTGVDYVKSFSEERNFVAPLGPALRREPSNLTILALEPSTILGMPYTQYESFYPRFECMQEFGRKIAERYYSARENHTYDLLSLTGTDRYEAFRRQFPHLISRIPQKYVAGYLGISPESLSRILAKRNRNKRASEDNSAQVE